MRIALIYDMTKEQYKAEREARGTQAEVAELLKIARPTLSHRERGTQPITREAALAIQALPKPRK